MGNVFRNLDWSVLTNALISIIPALICITVHELAHGYAAYRLGDTTAKEMGRLTLNPLKHLDIVGILMMILVGFGWAKPVPVNMRRFRKPKVFMAITALAGPLSNIIMAVVVFFIYGLVFTGLGGYKATGAGDILLSIVSRTATLSVALAIFNLIPIPPLDGSKIVFSLLPEQSYYNLMRYERYGMLLLIALIYFRPVVFDATIGKANDAIIHFLLNIAQFSYNLIN